MLGQQTGNNEPKIDGVANVLQSLGVMDADQENKRVEKVMNEVSASGNPSQLFQVVNTNLNAFSKSLNGPNSDLVKTLTLARDALHGFALSKNGTHTALGAPQTLDDVLQMYPKVITPDGREVEIPTEYGIRAKLGELISKEREGDKKYVTPGSSTVLH